MLAWGSQHQFKKERGIYLNFIWTLPVKKKKEKKKSTIDSLSSYKH